MLVLAIPLLLDSRAALENLLAESLSPPTERNFVCLTVSHDSCGLPSGRDDGSHTIFVIKNTLTF